MKAKVSRHNLIVKITAKPIVLVELSKRLWEYGTFLRHSSVEPLAIEYKGAIAK
jgi:hypothetical protein